MANQTSALSIVAILLAVVAIAAIAYMYGVAPYAGAGFGAGAGIVTKEGKCPDTGLTDIRVAAWNDLDSNKAQVSTPVKIYLAGSPTSSETVYTATSGVNGTTSDLACGSDYTAVFGDSATYYELWMEGQNTGDSATNTLKKAVEKVGSLAITGSNQTMFGVSTGVVVALGSGEDSSDAVLKLKENTAIAYFGSQANPAEPTIKVCADYPVSNFTSVEVVGATEGTIPTIAAGYEKCFDVKTNALVNFGTSDQRIFINTKDGVNPIAASNITIKVFDYAWIDYQGKKYWDVQNPADSSAIGATDQTYTIYIDNSA